MPFHLVNAQPFGDRFVDRVARVECAGRILKNHLHPTTQRSQTTPTTDRLTKNGDRAMGERFQPDDRTYEGCLAAARLTDERHHLAATDFQRDGIDGAHAATVELHLHVRQLNY